MKKALLVLLMLASACSAQMQLSISEETRTIICQNSGGVWTPGSGCACQPDWTWQDSFGCIPFGSNPQALCTNTNGQWKYYGDSGVNACVCPGAEAGIAFDPKTGCPAYTPTTTTIPTPSIAKSKDISTFVNQLTPYLYNDINKDPGKYIVYLLYLIGGIIFLRVAGFAIKQFFPKNKDIVVVQ